MTEQVEIVSDFELVGELQTEQATEVVDEQQEVDQQEPEQEEQQEYELTIEDTEASPASDVEQDDIEIPEDAPNWAKQLRQGYKELARENKRLKTQQAHSAVSYEPEVFNEPYPELEDEDVAFDTAKHRQKVLAWTEKKAQFDEKQRAKKAEVEQVQVVYNQKLQDYESKKQSMLQRFPDFQAAEQAAAELPVVVQNAAIMYAADPAAFVLAVGRNKEVRDKLAKLQNDPVALGVEIERLNRAVKVGPKPKPAIEPAPTVKAPTGKPMDADEKRFRSAFPDAKFS